jgi:hypothetical protein
MVTRFAKYELSTHLYHKTELLRLYSLNFYHSIFKILGFIAYSTNRRHVMRHEYETCLSPSLMIMLYSIYFRG